MQKQHNKNKKKIHNICIKRWKNIPLYSIRWSEFKIELLLFKIFPIVSIPVPKYEEKDEGTWVAM